MHTSADIQFAANALDEGLELVGRKTSQFVEASQKLAAAAKKGSQDTRTAADNLQQGLQRILKQADLQKLESYANALERVADAMTKLAELERTGKLERIAGALK